MTWQSPHVPSGAPGSGIYLWSPIFFDEEEDWQRPPITMAAEGILLVPPDPLPYTYPLAAEDVVGPLYAAEDEDAWFIADSPQVVAGLGPREAPVDDTPIFIGKYIPTLDESFLGAVEEAWYAAGTFDSVLPFPDRTPASYYSDSSCNILSEIQRHFLESTIDDGVTWSLWTEAEVLKYFNDRLKRFYIETGLIRKRQLFSASSRTVALPADVMEVRRMIWWSSSNVPSALTREDKWALDNGFPGWKTETGTPIAYVEEPQTSRSITLYPYTSGGTLEVCYVPYPDTIAAGCQPMPIPAMFSHVIKYGIMADMLSKEGEANDNERAQFFLQRWVAGIQLAKLVVGRWMNDGSNNS